MTGDIDGKIRLNSMVYDQLGNGLSSVPQQEEELQVLGRAITESTKQFVQMMLELHKKRNISTAIGVILGLLSIILSITEVLTPTFLIVGLVLLVSTGAIFFYFQRQINSIQPEEKLVKLTRLHYPILIQSNHDGLIMIDGLALNKDTFEFPSYLDNNIITRSVASSGQAVNEYQKFLISPSVDQLSMINKNAYQREMNEASRVEIFVDQNLSPLKSATGDKNIKRFKLEIPTISGSSPFVDNLSQIMKYKGNYTLEPVKIRSHELDKEMFKDKTTITVTPTEINNWIEGLESWASEAEGQDIIEFTNNLQEILQQSGENLEKILAGLSKLIDVTLPASRPLYRQYNNYLTCYDCSIDQIKEQEKKIDIKVWIKDKLLIGVLDDPIFNPSEDKFESELARNIVSDFKSQKLELEHEVENSFGKVPAEYPFVLIKSKVPEVEVEENLFDGSVRYQCPNCGFIDKLLSIPRFIHPMGMAYATVFWENTKHMEERGDPIIRNVNEIKTSKQQRETGLAPLETNYLNSKRNYVSASAKLSKAEKKYARLQTMM